MGAFSLIVVINLLNRTAMNRNHFEGEWVPPQIKLPEDKTYLKPAKAFAQPGCWTNEELEERYWTRRHIREQYISPREPIEFLPKYTPIIQMVVDAKRIVGNKLCPALYNYGIHGRRWHRIALLWLGAYSTIWFIVNRVQYSQIPDRRFMYINYLGNQRDFEIEEVKPEDVNKYIEEKYLHRTSHGSGHHWPAWRERKRRFHLTTT